MPGLDWKKLDQINVDTLETVILRILYNTFWGLLTEDEKAKAKEEWLSKSFWRGAYIDGAEYAYNRWRDHPAHKSQKMLAAEELCSRCSDAVWDHEWDLLPSKKEDQDEENKEVDKES